MIYLGLAFFMIFIGLDYTAADDPQDSDFDPTDGASSRGGTHVSVFSTFIFGRLYALFHVAVTSSCQ